MATNEEANGRFCWYDLMTTDVEAAKKFYTALIGWDVETWEGGANPYTMWKGPNGPIGGVMTLPEEAKKMGAPPHWMAYNATPDVDALVKKVQSLGGKVLVPGVDIPKVGRFAVLQDPQGAAFSAITFVDQAPGHDGEAKIGEVSWNELATTDHAAAFTFYETIFGWTKGEAMDMGPEVGTYQMFSRGGPPLGGIFIKPAQMPGPPHWLYYVRVDDVKAKVDKAVTLGAKLLDGPMEVPGGDMVAQLMDPQGVAFAMHSAKK